MPAGLTRTVALVGLARAAGTASVLLVNAMLARAWPAEQVGAWVVVWVLGSSLVPLFLLGLPTTVLYLYPRRDGAGRRALGRQAALALTVAAALLVAVLALAGAPLVGWLAPQAVVTPRALQKLLLPFLPYLFATVSGGAIDALLVAAGRVRLQALLALLQAVGQVAAAGAAVGLGLSPAAVFGSFSLVAVLRTGVGWLLVQRGAAASTAPDATWREVATCAVPVWLNDAVGGLSRYADRFVVTCFFSAAVVAQYHVAAVEVPVGLLLGAVVTVLVPEFSRLYQEQRSADIHRLWCQTVSRLALVVMPLFAFLSAFATSFMAVYLPGNYASGLWVFRLLLLALPVRCAVYGPVLVAIGRAHWAVWASLLDLVLSAGVGWFLTGAAHAQGATWAFLVPAAAAVLATYVQVAVLLVLIGRQLAWGRSVLPWGDLARVGSRSALAAVLAWVATAGLPPSGPRLVAGGLVFTATLAFLTWRSERDRAACQALWAAVGRRSADGR
jgi:O-antigen/teichoic acid export membrane protein